MHSSLFLLVILSFATLHVAQARTCTFNPPGFFQSFTPPTNFVWLPDAAFDFTNSLNWNCDDTGYNSTVNAGDNVIVNMTGRACSQSWRNGARMIVSTSTPQLNSVSIITDEVNCDASDRCLRAPWQSGADLSYGLVCFGSVVVNVGGTLNTNTITIDQYSSLNLNGGTVKTGTLVSQGGIAGTGKIIASSSVQVSGGSSRLLPGWFSQTAPVYLDSTDGCANFYPRWAPNGGLSMYGDLYFDTPTASFDSCNFYYLDLVNVRHFPNRANPTFPYSTITFTGQLNLNNLQFWQYRTNNTGGSLDSAPLTIDPPTTPFTWGPNPQLLFARSYTLQNPINLAESSLEAFLIPKSWKSIALAYTGHLGAALPLACDGLVPRSCQTPAVCPLPGDQGFCLVAGSTGGNGLTSLSITVQSVRGDPCSQPQAPAAVVQVPPTTGSDGSTTAAASDRSGVPLGVAIGVPIAVVGGAAIAILVFVLWRRSVKRTTREMQEFAKQSSIQDLHDEKAANAALRMPINH